MLTRDERLQLKAATRLMVREAGGQEACAMASERIARHQSFSEMGDPQRGEKYMCIDTVAEIERFGRAPLITRVLAELSGHILVELPIVPGSNSKLDHITGQTLTEIGEVFTRLGAARADGKIGAMEQERLCVEIREAVTMLLRLEGQIAAEACCDD